MNNNNYQSTEIDTYSDLRKSVRLIAIFEVGACLNWVGVCLNWRWSGLRSNCFPQFSIRLPGVISFHIFHLTKKYFCFALTVLQENWQLKCNSQHTACSGGQTIFITITKTQQRAPVCVCKQREGGLVTFDLLHRHHHHRGGRGRHRNSEKVAKAWTKVQHIRFAFSLEKVFVGPWQTNINQI